MTTTLLYVRHADVFNPDNLLYGRLPRFRLSDYGKYFAARTAQYLAREPITAFYTSPLVRARQTTRILAQPHPGVPIYARMALAEIRTSWQGTAYDALPEGKTVYETRREPKDESIDDVWQRLHRFTLELVAKHAGETVVCVSHGDPIKILSLGLQGRVLDEQAVRVSDPARCSVTRIVYRDAAAPPDVSYTDVVGGPAFRRVAALADLPLGSLTRVSLRGRDILLVRTAAGAVYALSNHCSHMRAHLHEGALDDEIVTCPLHGSQFQASNGKLVRGPQCAPALEANFGQPGRALTPIEAGPVPAFEVRIEGDDVLIRPH